MKRTSRYLDAAGREAVSISYSGGTVWTALATILIVAGAVGGLWFLLDNFGVL